MTTNLEISRLNNCNLIKHCSEKNNKLIKVTV